MSYVELKQNNPIDIQADVTVIEVNEKLKAVSVAGTLALKKLSEKQSAFLASYKTLEISKCLYLDDPLHPMILTRSPIWINGFHNETKQLYEAYLNILMEMKERNLHSVALPLLACSSIGYPISGAWSRGLKACKDFMKYFPDYSIVVLFCIKDEGIIKIGQKVVEDLDIPQKKITQLDDQDLYLLHALDQNHLKECIDSLCHRYGKGKGCFSLFESITIDENEVKAILLEKKASEMNIKEIQKVLQFIKNKGKTDEYIENRYLLKLVLRIDDLLAYLES